MPSAEAGVAGDDQDVRQWVEEDVRKFLVPLAKAFMQGLVKVAERRVQVYYSEPDSEKVGTAGQH